MNNIADFTTGFWSGWVAVLSVLGIVFVCGLLWTSAHGKNIRAEESVWDETLREGDAAPPQWWFFLFLALIIFSCAYLVLYPGLGGFRGTLGWTQYGQYEKAKTYYDERFGGAREKWKTASFAEIAADESAMQTAAALFAEHCAACHGRDGRGQANMFPNVADDVWQWGEDADSIFESVAHGRLAAMPSQVAALGGVEEAKKMAKYVRNNLQNANASASANAAAANESAAGVNESAAGNAGANTVVNESVRGNESAAGVNESAAGNESMAAKFAQVCAACHGANGTGNAALGAPDLTDDVWLYGGGEEAILEGLILGRNGEMPAQLSRLGEARSRLLAAWLATGKIKEFPPR